MVEQAVVLLPTYNESDNLPRLVPAILQAAPVDVLILDDASPDGTGTLADQLAAHEPRVQVVHRLSKQGLGLAYVDGFQRALSAGYTYIIEMDADFSHSPDYLPTMLQLAKSYDVVLGSRWLAGGGTRHWPMYRQVLSKVGSLYARLILGIPIRDLTGGFKCLRREVLEGIDLASITTQGYGFQIEITYRALVQGFRVIEMPITFVDRQQGTSKMNQRIVWEALLKVPQLRFKWHP